jgi:hypothetical protein
MLESSFGHSNMFDSSANLQLLCLENETKAKWLIFARIECQEKRCSSVKIENYLPSLLNSRTNTYIYQVSKAVIGVNCQVFGNQESHQEWSCQEFRPRQGLTIKTTGKTPILYHSDYMREYGNLPDFPTSLQGVDRSAYIDCRGDASFCIKKQLPEGWVMRLPASVPKVDGRPFSVHTFSTGNVFAVGLNYPNCSPINTGVCLGGAIYVSRSDPDERRSLQEAQREGYVINLKKELRGFFSSQEAASGTYNSVIWQQDGLIFRVTGRLSKTEVIAIAFSMANEQPLH